MSDLPRRRRSGLSGHRDFRSLWIADTVSQFGVQVSVLAMPLVAVLYLHAGPPAVGVLVAMEFLGSLLIGLPAGVWCDRRRRRPIMVCADLVRAGLLASVPLAAWCDALTIWQLYAVALAQGFATVFFDVAYQSYLPTLIQPGDLVEGNTKLQASASVAQMAGPSVAGVLVQVLTAPLAITANAVSFGLSGLFIANIRQTEPAPSRPEKPRLLRDVREGLGLVLRDPILRALAGATAVVNLFMSVFAAVITTFLAHDLRLSAGLIGVLMTAGSAGGLAGALAAPGLIRRVGLARGVWLPPLVGLPLGLLVPLTHGGIGLIAFVVGWFGCSFAIVAYNIAQVSLRQTLCPAGALGRMNATMRFLTWGVMPLGALLGGALGAGVGARTTLGAAQLGELLVPLVLIASPLRRIRELPAGEPEPTPSRDREPSAVDGVRQPVAQGGHPSGSG
ncbi:MFS transporter [Kitasatospora acidiphila]|uniref:MFS transporter n=1 Tax=Kitasatospora acidiphila TaxID=2567942 RepID=A0A540VXQ1_9ACTN|nr:MFS transporter [Kitasatospora acidiphila]TQF01535.1 MFS transporter [Kitasatospora acidiphila]